jgi:hypothetical protein
MRFGGHETFAVREGWLHKGMTLLDAQPERQHDPFVADHLGVGRNMAKSIWHWLKVTRLIDIEREGRETRMARLQIEGFALVPSQSIPDLDAPCGKHLRFRDFIECGETQQATGLANIPQQPETYHALAQLAAEILDPVIEYFGMIELTFGFCSRELAKAIAGRIAPKLDQHAACERNTRGNPICPRLGAAVDFIVRDESMLEVAQWIVEHTPFDRLYFYGDTLPLHASYGPHPTRTIVRMLPGRNGKLIPRETATDTFSKLSLND